MGFYSNHRLFANTPRSAQTGAVIYSLIEATKEAGPGSLRYLTWNLNLSWL